MAPKTIKMAILAALEDLEDADLEKFCSQLLDHKGKRVRTSWVMGKSRVHISSVLVQTYAEKGAVKVVLETLRDAGFEQRAKKFEKATRNFTKTKRKTKARGASGAAASGPVLKSDEHFIDKHRYELIDRVSNIDGILDDLLQAGVIKQEMYDKIRARSTTQDMMRDLYSGPLKADVACKDIFYNSLKKNEKYLMNEIKSKSKARGASGAASSEPDRAGVKHFIDKHRHELIDRVSNIDGILDDLLQAGVTEQEMCVKIRARSTTQDMMRDLYSGPLKAGKACKDIFYNSLKKNEKYLMNEIKSKSKDAEDEMDSSEAEVYTVNVDEEDTAPSTESGLLRRGLVHPGGIGKPGPSDPQPMIRDWEVPQTFTEIPMHHQVETEEDTSESCPSTSDSDLKESEDSVEDCAERDPHTNPEDPEKQQLVCAEAQAGTSNWEEFIPKVSAESGLTSYSNFKEFTPVTVGEMDEAYRFQSLCPGLYQCSVTGLVFGMETDGVVVYRTVPWDRRMLDQYHKKPAGPLFDITCVDKSVVQLHLPHCELRSTGGWDFLSVAHVEDDGSVQFIRPQKITETHVVISITGFSPVGNVKDKASPPDPVRALVLLFFRPSPDPDLKSVLNVLLLPKNVSLPEVKRSRREMVGDEIYIEMSSHCKLKPEQFYTLTTSPEDSGKVQPDDAEFCEDSYDNYIPTFQVFLNTGVKHLNLVLKDKQSSHSVWERGVFLSPTGVNVSSRSRSGMDAVNVMQIQADKAHFVIDTVRRKDAKDEMDSSEDSSVSFIRDHKMDLITCLGADRLILQLAQQNKVITDTEYRKIKSIPSKDDAVTELIDVVMHKGPDRCRSFLQILKEPKVVETYPLLEEIMKDWK
ncbi:uncharacterized protein LOC115435198 isoform X2 [Sphaeramia orbicularis]|uniref:Uncharacterized LOC115435198 n=1 Tax=Sphaeramia orbicularis TaxID=375764 RepID=A0A673A0Y9_9TELE|nr:uncharacterized protein LOC115435198 isoform X2 [Sphaeramia orbicularis]